MFDFYSSRSATEWLKAAAAHFLEALQMNESYTVKQGKVQLMVYGDGIGKLGGLSTIPRGQYILAPKAYGRIESARLRQLGFHIKYRSDGSPYWYCPGHDDFRGFRAALAEMTGVDI